MRGSVRAVWSRAWGELWQPLSRQKAAPADLFCELYRSLASALMDPPSLTSLIEIIDDPQHAYMAFQRVSGSDFASERSLLTFMEDVYGVLDELSGEVLANQYFNRLASFIDTYNLRYELRRPCRLYPTLSGVFANLMHELRSTSAGNPHLHSLLHDVDEAFRDLHDQRTEGRIKTCLQKQVNLLEALGRSRGRSDETSLTHICNAVGDWPHRKVGDAIKNLYNFTCDYPGIRHGGKPGSALRPLDMRDLVSVCILLTGFTPYLSDQLDADAIFQGWANG